MSKIYCNKYKQNEQEFISTVMSVQDISRISKALIYGKDPNGYQRVLNKKHVKNISNSIKNNDGLVSPTSIVLGIDIEELNKVTLDNVNENIFTLDTEKIEDESFRIIDGQHRIEGFKEAIRTSEGEKSEKLKEYKLNVIIMLIHNKNKIEEVKVFRDINSKAKPLKVDLAILALYECEKRENSSSNNFHLSQYISIKVAYKLNENEINKDSSKINVWQNGIILDPNADKKTAIIGFKTYCESISKICKLVIEKYNLSKEIESKELDLYVDEIVNDLIVPCWDIVYNKWKQCFIKKIIKSDVGSIIVYHNKEYYLQKTIGAKSINLLLANVLESQDLNYNKSIIRFKYYIENSELTYEDWLAGSRFAGLSSEAGIKKVSQIIQNK